MRKHIQYLFLFFLTISSCEKKIKNKTKTDNTIKSELLNSMISSDLYDPKTICKCNDDGTKILNELLSKRKQFKSIKDLNNDENASEYVKLLKKNWDTIRWKCLKTFGTGMFTPSNCNNPDNIQEIKDKLFELDIRT